MSDEHADIRERLPAYALGSLDKAEAAETARHVGDCPDCRAEWADYAAVVDALALAAPDAAPSPALRDRLLAAARDAKESADPTPVRIDVARGAAGTAAPRRRPARRWPVLAVAALAAIVLGGLLWAAFGLLVAPGAPPVTLLPTDIAPEADGELVFARGGWAATLTVRGLPVLPAGRQYQLWLVSDDERESGAVFSVNANGWAETAVEMERAAAEYDRFGITIEPAGGSPGPTGERVLGFARDG